MKIVIDIEESRYNWIMSHASNDAGDYVNSEDIVFRKAVESSTVLPKGHGDLIEREDARMCLTGEIPYDMTIDKYIARTDTRLRGLSPVISADKGE